MKAKVDPFVGKMDMYIDKNAKPDWARVRLCQDMYVGDNGAFLAAPLVRCEVSDPDRWGFYNGSWYKLEQADFLKPKTSEDARSFTLADDGQGGFTRS